MAICEKVTVHAKIEESDENSVLNLHNKHSENDHTKHNGECEKIR